MNPGYPIAAAGIVLGIAVVLLPLTSRSFSWGAAVVADALMAAGDFLLSQWLAGAVVSALMVFAGWMWNCRRRKRRRAASLLGAKSRALRERLVRVMRRERRPSRVLRPHPVPS